jgi:hypothetical protein
MIMIRSEEGQPMAGALVYRAAEYAFATEPRPMTCGASFTINEVELMLADEEDLRVSFIEGYCPFSGWRKAVLCPPPARAGILRGEAVGRLTSGSAMAINSADKRWPVLVDLNTGWVRLGTGDPAHDREGVAFAPGAIGVIEGDRLLALWLHPEQLPAL